MKSKTTMMFAAGALAGGLLLSGCASDTEDSAPTATTGTLELEGFWVKESSLDMSAGYGTISNSGDGEEVLTGATAAGVPMIELHETVEGVMRQVPSFAVPAGGDLVLEPGANHLMLMDLAEPLVPGETLEITLEFESGATATVVAPIKPFSGDDGHSGADGKDDGHSGHNH